MRDTLCYISASNPWLLLWVLLGCCQFSKKLFKYIYYLCMGGMFEIIKYLVGVTSLHDLAIVVIISKSNY